MQSRTSTLACLLILAICASGYAASASTGQREFTREFAKDIARWNRLYDHKRTKQKQDVEFLITGCARSGTMYMTQVFQRCGFQVRHEVEASFGIVSWFMAVDSDYCPFDIHPSNHFFFKHIFHQVRHPLKTMASAMTEPPDCWKYICSHIPQIKMSDSPLVRSAKYWVYWNLRAEKKAELTYRVEDALNILPELGKRLGITLDPALAARVPKNTFTRKHPPLSWEQLYKGVNGRLFSRIVDLANRYGYNVDEAQQYLNIEG